MSSGGSCVPQKNIDTLAADNRSQQDLSFFWTVKLTPEASMTPLPRISRSPQKSIFGVVARLSSTIRCRSGGETEFQIPPDPQKVQASEQPGCYSAPPSRRSNPQTFSPRSARLLRPGYPYTVTHSRPRRETPIHSGGSPLHRW